MRRARASRIPSNTKQRDANVEVLSRIAEDCCGTVSVEKSLRSWLPNPASANALLDSRAKTRQRSDSVPATVDTLQFLRINDVCRLLRISKPTLWRLRQNHQFPEPTSVTDRLIAWRRSEI